MNEPKIFAEIVDEFLEKWCEKGPELRVTELALFAKFRVYWAQEAQRWIHEASFHDFQAALKQRGYSSSRKGRRYWFGLHLRNRPK
ncbi:MAG: hypothetical protein NVS4B7_02780 [Ktedonobacteraceae bacterium]